jgi:hypothetical protein
MSFVVLVYYYRGASAAVPRWEPETVNVAWEPETVNRKGLQVS